MAQAIICDVCNTNVAAFLVTNMADGATFAGCGPDFLDWCRAMTQAVDGQTPETATEAPDAGAPDTQGEGAEGAPAEGPPKSEPETATEPEPESQPDESAAPAPTND